MAKRKLTKTERDEWNAFFDQMRDNAERTRRLAKKAQAELDAKLEREQQAS